MLREEWRIEEAPKSYKPIGGTRIRRLDPGGGSVPSLDHVQSMTFGMFLTQVKVKRPCENL